MKSLKRAKRKAPAALPLCDFSKRRNQAEDNPRIVVAVVSDPGTSAFADSIETMLAETRRFTCARFEYRGDAAIQACTAPPDDPDVVVVTIGSLPADNQESLFAALRQTFPQRAVLAIANQSDGFDIFQVLQMGAADFVLPPLRRSELVPRLMRQARVTGHTDPMLQKLKEDIGLKQVIGESRIFLNEVQRLPRFARCDATVLIAGESGTGKEIFARAIHYLSARAGRAFVPVNCGALPEHLMESEIFGHKRGAFTSATSDYAGLIGEAEGGTLFLDEIDALTRPAQVKLLRFLQDGEYRPVGSQQIAHANLRVVAAANVDFVHIVRAGKFREDLFYRLNVLTLTLPPLRDRRGDILLLSHHFLEKQAALAAEPPKKLSLAALNRLLSHSWPGNVRELENVLTRAVVMCDRDTIEPPDLDLPGDGPVGEEQTFQAMKTRVVRRFEHDFLETVLRAHQGNITHAACAVKKNRRAFWELLRKHGLLAAAARD